MRRFPPSSWRKPLHRSDLPLFRSADTSDSPHKGDSLRNPRDEDTIFSLYHPIHICAKSLCAHFPFLKDFRLHEFCRKYVKAPFRPAVRWIGKVFSGQLNLFLGRLGNPKSDIIYASFSEVTFHKAIPAEMREVREYLLSRLHQWGLGQGLPSLCFRTGVPDKMSDFCSD